jgi:hypothetical protein
MVLTAYVVLTPERPGFVVSVAPRASTRETWHLPLGRQACTPSPSVKLFSSARLPTTTLQPISNADRLLRLLDP